MISLLFGVMIVKFGLVQVLLFGISVDVVDDEVYLVLNGGGGYLVLTESWLLMLRGIWGDDEWYKEMYWLWFEGWYFVGDGDCWLLMVV